MLLDNHENRSGSRPVNRQPRPSESVEGETGLPDRIKNKIILISVLRLVVDHSQLHSVRLDILVDDQHICRKVRGGFLLCDMHNTISRDKQTYHLLSHFNKYWGGSLS